MSEKMGLLLSDVMNHSNASATAVISILDTAPVHDFGALIPGA